MMDARSRKPSKCLALSSWEDASCRSRVDEVEVEVEVVVSVSLLWCVACQGQEAMLDGRRRK